MLLYEIPAKEPPRGWPSWLGRPAYRARPSGRRLAWRVALTYALLVTAWIVGSDMLIAIVAGPPALPAMRAELLKGLAFVLVSSALIFLLVAKVLATLNTSEQRLRLLAAHVPDMIYRLRLYPDCAFEYVSPAATTLAGYTPAEFYADPDLAFKLVHPDDRDRLAALGRGRTVDGRPVELRWIRKDGTVIWTEQRNVPIYDGQGRLVAIEGVARDIDQRKSAEEQIVWQRRALERAHAALVNSYDVTLSGWSQALDLRDRETEGHSARVTAMSVRLAQCMGICGEILEHFRRGALLHDIGKIGIPDAILHKPGPLSDPEWSVMRRHPEHARALLEPIEFLRPALDIPYCHHERWDGTGYPRGLCGEQIPLAARIFAVVDVWDALTSDRPYRAAWSGEQVRSYLLAGAGRLFDPSVVTVFLGMLESERRGAARRVA